MRALLLLGALAVGLAAATPTRPVLPDVGSLPVTYLATDKYRSAFRVTTTKPPRYELVAEARYNASNADMGWDYLHVRGLKNVFNSTEANVFHDAGYLEGYLTAATIYAANDFASLVPTDAAVMQWVTEHISYMQGQVRAAGDADPYWRMVGNILAQMEGLVAGCNAAAKGPQLTFQMIFLANFADEIGDVQTHVGLKSGVLDAATVKRNRVMERMANGMHCSALIKVLPEDLFMAHDTWSVFSQMAVRTYKVYEFPHIAATVSLSGYPGTIASGDDWYMTSHDLAVQETTNGVFNTSLFVNYVLPNTVSEFVRVMVATYTAYSGEEWTRTFSRENSGTYNNQYMVVDWKVYAPGSSLAPGTLWVAEQLPGTMARGDVTDVLRTQGFWASYNIPYFRVIFQLSGYAEMEAEQGTFWSYTKYARPEIFKRNQTLIRDVAGMQKMMRYNNYLHDEYSIIPNCTGATNDVCNPMRSSMLTIASRGDLMPVYNTTAEMIAHYGPLYFFVAQGCFGALDAKIARYSARHNLAGLVINGPTNDQQPTFDWSGACGNQVPSNSVARYDFPWIEFPRTYFDDN